MALRLLSGVSLAVGAVAAAGGPMLTEIATTNTTIAGGTFKEFSFPQFDPSGVAVFAGTATNNPGGIWGSRLGGRVFQYVDQASAYPSPGASFATGKTFGGGLFLGQVSTNRVGFLGGSSAGDLGVFIGSPSGSVSMVTDSSSTRAPGGGSFMSPSVPGYDAVTGTVVFMSALQGSKDANLTKGVFAAIPSPGKGKPWPRAYNYRLLAGSETKIPQTSDGSYLACFGGPSVAGGRAFFFASQCDERLLGRSTMVHTRHPLAHALTTDHVRPGVYSAPLRGGSGLQVLANWNSKVPGGGANETFVAFSDPAVSPEGTATVFIGEGSQTLGVYVAVTGAAGGRSRLCKVADITDVAPGSGGVTFSDFPETPSVSGGDVVFYAVLANSNSGVYVAKGAAAACAAGDKVDQKTSMKPVITNSDSIAGLPIVYIGFGPNAYYNGQALIYVVLENNDLGIYSVKVN